MSDNKLVPTAGALVKQLEKSGSLSSLADLVRVRENENVALLVDVSGSMADYVDDVASANRNYTRRIDALRIVVRDVVQKKLVPVYAFGGPMEDSDHRMQYVWQVPYDAIPEPVGGTPLRPAIEMARQNGYGRLLVISDGNPEDRSGCLEAAKQFGGRIDVVFVGPANDWTGGSEFLDELARATGGNRFEGDLGDTKQIASTIAGLLAGEVMEEVDEDDDEDDDDEDDDEDEEDEDDE